MNFIIKYSDKSWNWNELTKNPNITFNILDKYLIRNNHNLKLKYSLAVYTKKNSNNIKNKWKLAKGACVKSSS